MAKTATQQRGLPPLLLDTTFGPVEIPTKIIWTASALKLFRKCKRKFFWKYIMRLKPRHLSSSLMIGHAFHDALSKWYQSKRAAMQPIALAKAKDLEDSVLKQGDLYDQDDLDKLTTAVDTLTGMLTAYADIYKTDKSWTIDRKNVETEFQVDMGDFMFQGKIDLVATEKKDEFVTEHKTASSIGETYIDRLALDTQVRAYIYGAVVAKNLKPKHVLYNVVRKCRLRRKSNESVEDLNQRIQTDYMARPDFYFYREKLMFASSDVRAFEYEMKQTHRELVHILNGSEDPKDPRTWTPNDGCCNEYFKLCPYFGLCTKGLDRGIGSSFTQNDSMHEELADIAGD